MGKGLEQTGIDVKTEHFHVHEMSHIVTHFQLNSFSHVEKV